MLRVKSEFTDDSRVKSVNSKSPDPTVDTDVFVESAGTTVIEIPQTQEAVRTMVVSVAIDQHPSEPVTVIVNAGIPVESTTHITSNEPCFIPITDEATALTLANESASDVTYRVVIYP